MVSDQQPRYRLVDPDTGTVVGTVYANDSGDTILQDANNDTDALIIRNGGDIDANQPIDANSNDVKNIQSADAEVIDLAQSVDDGSDRLIVRSQDGNVKSEIYFDGSNTVVNPLTGNVDVQGALQTEQATIGAIKLDHFTLTIPDDNVTTQADDGTDIDVNVFSWVRLIGDSTLEYAEVTLKFDDFDITQLGDAVTDQSSTDLGGTDGPDGTLNLSMSSGLMHFENRTGDEVTIDLLTMNRP